MKKTLLSIVLLSIVQLTMAFSFNDASWISINENPQKENQWICFRKQIYISQTNKSMLMNIGVDSKYWLWVNGKIVIFEGGLKRGPNPYDTYFDTVELSKYLHRGNNTIAILVWYWGKDGFCHKSSGKAGLIAKINVGKQIFVTDKTWKAKINPAFGDTGNPKPNYRLPESNVHYDATKELMGWYQVNYDDSSWSYASECGIYPSAPWNKLISRPFPNWKDSGIIKYNQVKNTIKNDSIVSICSLPKNITVTAYIKVKAKAGEIIDIRSDNYKGGSEYNVRAEYVTKNGVQSFEMPNYINGHHIIYKIPNDVKILRLGYRETAFDTKHIGKFICNDNFYNKLWNKALNTMNLNMRDAIQDPDRERSQWWGDAAIISGEILYSCDNNGVKAIKKAIYNLVDWQKPDGTLFSPIPSGSWDKELPQQMLASIGKYGFWNYYYYTGDINTLRHVYPAVKKYMALWSLDNDGLVKHRSGGWDWADWGDNIDVTVLDNAWYCLALESTADMARLMGENSYALSCDSIRQRVIKSAKKTFWLNGIFRSPKYTGVTDDRANGMAILAGFSTFDQETKIRKFLKSRYSASPYMEKYILESFFVKGYIDEGLERMKQRYKNMVDSKLTTLWEDWQIGGAGGGSINHGWAGGPLTLLSQYVAGITPIGVGWRTIEINPQLGCLKWVKCSIPVNGKIIKIDAQQEEHCMTISVDNETERECVVIVPAKVKKVTLNNKKTNGDSIRVSANIKHFKVNYTF